jgi:hypothetical protein
MDAANRNNSRPRTIGFCRRHADAAPCEEATASLMSAAVPMAIVAISDPSTGLVVVNRTVPWDGAVRPLIQWSRLTVIFAPH